MKGTFGEGIALENQHKKFFMRTQAQRDKHKRWLRKHPDYVLARLKKWVEKEKDPKEKERAEKILERFLKYHAGKQKEKLPNTGTKNQDTLKLDA